MTNWKNKRVLVTGGAGFLGSHLTERILLMGSEITVVDSLLTGKIYNLKKVSKDIEFVNADCIKFFEKDPDYDIAFHFAATYPSRLMMHVAPVELCKNFSMNDAFFQWARRTSPDKIFLPSSPACYPIKLQTGNHHIKLKENMMIPNSYANPDGVYGWSKVIAELEMKFLIETTKVKGVVVRPFSGYGPRQSQDFPATALIARAVNKEDPMVVWGSEKQVRDFIYIDDIVDGIILAMEKINDGSPINLGTGMPTNFVSLSKIICEIVGYAPKIKTLKNKPLGVMYRVANNSLAQKMGWKPKTSLKEGMEKTIEWYKSFN